ncbi:BZZ1 [Sanghuangporus weigelae]
MSTGKLYGDLLPDQVDRIAALSDAQLGLLSDVREIYKERSALEKEYSTKLAVLAKKAADRKAKRMASLVLGDDPSVAWGEDTIRSSTLDKAYGQLVNSLDSTAQDHSALSDSLITQVADETKILEKKHEDMKTKQYEFYQKLLSERDKVYADRQKVRQSSKLRSWNSILTYFFRQMKQKYDEECLEVESYRRKQDRSTDDKHASRAAKQFENQMIDMQNSKNIFLISTAVANRTKNRFYSEDLPLIENANLITGLTSILLQAQQLHTSHLDTSKSRVSTVREALEGVKPSPDQDLYINYNARPFNIPNDWEWEPCAGHYDTGEMVVEPEPKVVLQNKLSRCREKLGEINGLINAQRKDVDKLSNILSTYINNRSLGSVDDIMNDYLGVRHQLTLLEFTATILNVEIETINDALGGDEGLQSPHNFKSTSFSIPTACGYCKSSIWGLTKQGKTCKSCGLCVHAKCELKVPANCGGGGAHAARTLSTRRGADISRADSRASSISQTSVSSTQGPSSLSRSYAVPEETYPQARVLYDFTPSSPFELSATGGMTVQVVEDDDGSGWVKVADTKGGKGLVPASYIEVIEGNVVPPPVPVTTKPKQQASGKYVRGLYTYEATGPDEINIEEGGMYELSSGAGGGQNYADGWWEGYDSTGKKGIFPSNYESSTKTRSSCGPSFTVHTRMPLDIEGFRKAGYQAIDRICDFYYSLEKRGPAADVEPGYLRKALPDQAPDQGEDFQQIADDYLSLVQPGLTVWQHPSFFAYFPTAATFEGTLGDLYATAIPNPGFNWECSPACTELEAVVMDWSAKLFGLDEAFYNERGRGGGVIQTTASDSGLVSIVAARSAYTRVHPEVDISKLVIYTTTQTHSLGEKAALILGLRARALDVTLENAFSLRGTTLQAALEEDINVGLHPFVLVATVGTTSSGAVDNLAEILEVAKGYPSLWVHVDAAWAGVTLACPEYRRTCYLDQINQFADSFCVNFHKWGLVNFDCSGLWVRDRRHLIDALDITPEFLRSKHSEEGTVIDYRNWHLSLGRRFRSLKIWFVLRSFGVQGFQEYIRRTISLNDRFVSLVQSSGELLLVAPPSFAISVFHVGAPADAENKLATQNRLTQALYKRLGERRDIVLTKTVLNDIFCIRFAVGSAWTEERHIDAAYAIIMNEARVVIAEDSQLNRRSRD